jgi:tripartite-type tricarboxylate transporter receptor subunit TctC
MKNAERRKLIRTLAAAGLSASLGGHLTRTLAQGTSAPAGDGNTNAKWPTKPIKYIVPFLPGGMGDSMARLMQPYLTEILGQRINVENRSGGNALIGYRHVASEPADGYTWLAVTLTHAVNQTLFQGQIPAFSSAFRPIARLAESPLVVVVNPSVSANTLPELIALAKKKSLNVGSSGNGSPPHLGMALLESAGGVDFNHIPYRGGSASIMDLLSGQLDVIVSNHPECIAHVKAGTLRPLAVASKTRIASLPDVPTTGEAGYASVLIDNWTGLVVRARTPEPVVAALSAAVSKVMTTKSALEKIAQLGFTPALLNEGAFAAFWASEANRWGRLVREKKILPE